VIREFLDWRLPYDEAVRSGWAAPVEEGELAEVA